jgi:hypothetical protein
MLEPNAISLPNSQSMDTAALKEALGDLSRMHIDSMI